MVWPAQLLLHLGQTLSPGVGEKCALWKAIKGATGSVDWRSGLHATKHTQKLTKIHKKKTGTCGPWSLRCTLQESVSVWNQCSRHCNWKWEKYITDYLNFYGCHLFNLFNRLGIAKAAMLCSRCAILYYEQISW